MSVAKSLYLFLVQFLGYLWYLSLFVIIVPFLLIRLSQGLDYYIFEVLLNFDLTQVFTLIPITMINLVSLVFVAFGCMVIIESVLLLYEDAGAFPFTIITHKELNPTKLSRVGWYAVVRHPMIFGYISILIGLGIYFQLVSLVIWWTPLVSGIFLEYALMIEERSLLRWFGDDYRDYKKQVPAILPKLRIFHKKDK